MPGPITYSAIALLARDRLQQLRRSLRSKIENGRRVSDLERQLAYLAEQAERLMSAPAPAIAPPARLYGPPAGDQVSKFLFMGATGPDIPAFAAQFAPLQRWVRDTLHKGTPDEHHEQSLAWSTDYLLAFWRRVQPAITRDAALATPEARAAALAQMQSYVLGHCCHIAADVVTAPYIAALEGRYGEPGWQKLSRAQIISGIETEVSRLMFNGGPTAGGAELDSWFPLPAEVPAAFLGASVEAFTDSYGPDARHKGGAPFEARRAAKDPPTLDADLLEDGYRSFRRSLGARSWTFLDWLGATGPMFLLPFLALPLSAVMIPSGTDAFSDAPPAGLDPALAVHEAIGFPFAIGSLMPLAYSIGIAASPLGAEGPVIFGLVSGAVQVVAGATFIGLALGKVAGELPLRWALLFALPLLLELAFVIYALVKIDGDNPRRMLLVLGAVMHLFTGAVFALLFWAFLHRATDALKQGDPGLFVGLLVVWLLILAVIWIGTTLVMRFVLAPEPIRPSDVLGSTGAATPPPPPVTPPIAVRLDAALDPIPAGLPGGAAAATAIPRHPVELYDDGMLRLCNVDDGALRYFPPGRRPLLKLWWEGAGAPQLLARRDRLEFHFGAAVCTIRAPSVPIRLSEFSALLARNVRDGAGPASLHTELAYLGFAAFDDCLLPPGLLFAEAGDSEATQLARDLASATPVALGDSAATAFELFTAPRAALSVRYGINGPLSATALRRIAVRGRGLLSSGAAPNQSQLTVSGADATDLRALFQIGDVVEAPFGQPGAPRRRVLSVDSAVQITVDSAFPAALANARYGRAAVEAGAGTVSSLPAPNTSVLVATGSGPLDRLFQPGDAIEVPFNPLLPGVRRIVVSVDGPDRLTLNAPFPAAIAAQTYGRVARAASEDEVIPATWQVQAPNPDNQALQTNLVFGVGAPLFAGLFRAGDVIEATSPFGTVLRRTVTEVLGDATIRINALFDQDLAGLAGIAGPPAVPGVAGPACAFRRIGGAGEDLPSFLATPDDTLFNGQSLMNDAADLAMLLCLGATTHLLPDADLAAARHGGSARLNRAYQVFRNWNLDRRRVNEWKMLVLGGAVSEKSGAPADPDAALGAAVADWQSPTPAGAAISSAVGWLPLMRRWADLAGRPDNDVADGSGFRPGGESNLQLSQGIAFLLDQLAPAQVP